MEAIFIGTGAAEGNPAAYCRCPSCMKVRKNGGYDLRSRSSLRIGKYHQIDITPDNYRQLTMHDIDMYDIEHILVTHTHSDHLCISAVTDKVMSRETNEKPLFLYMSLPAKDLVESVVEASGVDGDMNKPEKAEFELIGLEYFESYQAGELGVETVKGNHLADGKNEYSINYLLKAPSGSTLLYALDTGYYTDETWEYLTGKRADTVVMDGTFGGREDRGEYPFGHLDNASFIRMLERMTKIGFIDSSTRVFATHINPHQGLDHEGLQNAYDESDFGVTVAYDGLRIKV